MKLMNKQEKSKQNLKLYLISTIKFKAIVDKEVIFLDGGNIPFFLIENKLDLSRRNWNNKDFEKFAQSNEFCRYFRTSAKTGYKISKCSRQFE